MLPERQHGAPPQVDALDGTEHLVTVTIGGNDVGYVPLLFAAGLPPLLRALPVLGGALRDLLDPAARERALADVGDIAAARSAQTLRSRAPQARVLFVDYLTLLPPAGHARPAAVRRRSPTSADTSPTAGATHRRGRRGHRLRGGAAPRRPAATTTPGRPTRGRWAPDHCCPGGQNPSTPTPRACERSRTWW